jgi:hypothetical protein
MSRNAIAVLAIVLVVGSSGLATGAFARGGDGGGGDGFRGNHLNRGFGGARGEGYGSYRNRGSSLRDEFRGYGGRDIWGHWGSYYGPML